MLSPKNHQQTSKPIHPHPMLVCTETFSNQLIVYIIFLSYLTLSIPLLYYFFTKRKLFPIRGRAPLLVILQAIQFWMVLFVPILTDILIRTNTVNWKDSNSNSTIPISRRLLKSLFMIARVSSILLFLCRALQIYFIWTRDEFFKGPLKLITHDGYHVSLHMAFTFVLFVGLYWVSDYYLTSVPFYDWRFNADLDFYYTYLFNFTWMHIFEQIVIWFGFW